MERLTNHHRQLTISFKYPCNGIYYIAVNKNEFKAYIWADIGSVHDWYIVQSETLDAPFKSFGRTYSRLVHEIHDEIIYVNSHTSRDDEKGVGLRFHID